MNNPDHFFDKILKTIFRSIPESNTILHAISILSNTPNYTDIGIETRYINEILKEMATSYARLRNQFKFKYHTLLPASFYKINEDNKRSKEFELFFILNINQNLTESDNSNIDVKSQLEHQFQIQETKGKGWIFDKIISMRI